MEFLDMVGKLQLVYGLKIILISCGSFYIAIGLDAETLNKELGLKKICAKKGLCKVGVPKTSIEKYKQKLDKIGYAYIILDYDKEKNKLVKKYEGKGKEIDLLSYNNECQSCSNRMHFNKTEYDIALEEFLKEEFGEKFV